MAKRIRRKISCTQGIFRWRPDVGLDRSAGQCVCTFSRDLARNNGTSRRVASPSEEHLDLETSTHRFEFARVRKFMVEFVPMHRNVPVCASSTDTWLNNSEKESRSTQSSQTNYSDREWKKSGNFICPWSVRLTDYYKSEGLSSRRIESHSRHGSTIDSLRHENFSIR